LTDSEVDRRFAMLVADLNLADIVVDWPEVSNAAESPADDDPEPEDDPSAMTARVGPLRLTAAVIAAVTAAVGLLVATVVDPGVVVGLVWFLLVVPAVVLVTVYVVDAVRRRRKHHAEQ